MLFSTFGQNYYIDIDKVDKEVELKSVSGDSQIHLVKYELEFENAIVLIPYS